MDFFFTPEASLAGLFIGSLLAATLLPGGSEFLLLAVVAAQPQDQWLAFALATLGNTLGGLISYGMGRCLPQKSAIKPVYLERVRHWGSPSLILAWVPIIGDVLCIAAGWLRLPFVPCALWLALGKGLRYLAVLGVLRVLLG